MNSADHTNDFANKIQVFASDPVASVFVSASAGSGKTKLLIDRLLRLMLPRFTSDGAIIEGVSPERILCLTFTKAAASEMSLRLQRTLGSWVTLSDTSLDKELSKLSVPVNPETRNISRALFARILDLPGGMRIGTIHAFCQSLLRRFPLEASINPHFKLMEEANAGLFLHEAAESSLPDLAEDILSDIAFRRNISEFLKFVSKFRFHLKSHEIVKRIISDPELVRKNLFLCLDVSPDDDPVRMICSVRGEDSLRSCLLEILEEGADGARKVAQSMLNWLSLPEKNRAERYSEWVTLFLKKKNEPKSNSGIKGNITKTREDIFIRLHEEALRICAALEVRKAQELARLTFSFLTAASGILSRFSRKKNQKGEMEYDDLINLTLRLLRNPGAEWVLYKLDGGIDHLLLDEVQDTSREQWKIAGALTSEFFSGEGAADLASGPRTVFAVGDYKQSIFGFQGADPEGFHEWKKIFKKRVEDAQWEWREPELTVSFRSTQPVLSLVDAVFSLPAAQAGIAEDHVSAPQHVSARSGQGGSVEIWPLAPAGEEEAPDPWSIPESNITRRTADQKLADALALHIRHLILRVPDEGEKPFTPQDFLILVRRRSAFVSSLVRALKKQQIPVSSLVTTSLAEQIAVRDLMTLCDALLLPQDDLTLACVLTSPLGGVSDESLMHLAMDRNGRPLWSVLRERHAERTEWRSAWRMLSGLFARVDYASPHLILCAALGEFGGRARLLARLGPEAAEPVDELLSAALLYEEANIPSLQGFAFWLRNSDAVVKRVAETAGNAVRIMTAHSSKGLQSRFVILPDTVGIPGDNSQNEDDMIFWTREKVSGLTLPLICLRKDMAVSVVRKLQEKKKKSDMEEYNRLLYVALTRAADHLLICGWDRKKKSVSDESWYAKIRNGFELLECRREDFSGGWEGERLIYEIFPEKSGKDLNKEESGSSMAAMPDWIRQGHAVPLPPEPAIARPLSPSRPDDLLMGPLPVVRSPLDIVHISPTAAREAAFRRGTLVHALLQYLPECPVRNRTHIAYDWLQRPGHALSETEAARLAARVIGVMDLPELADLFGPHSRAEQRLTGVAGGQVIIGQADRICVLPGEVHICDFKTNRRPPEDVSKTPVAYLRQMAAYRALLRQLWPGRQVKCCLVWTESVTVMLLPDSLLDHYGPEKNYRSS
ncbi:double-strand break repair helicase AddA [Acetobacter sp. AN02]|uniref:double-strand break repair helicase AddA n=1 Tax=Acetobacter sp. AN02 TaxID=2894186 RepID=UPI0024344AC5|nr:double-strand break repair helicase AddA [Acetobacter sp. AN02]MDG6094500.1 double-strand break repair helicase AddA [Acetobacter sp. AN02]